MIKKDLLVNFSFLVILMIFVILIAPIFIPNAVFIPKTDENNAKWISQTIPLSDINLIVYFAIVTSLCLIYLVKTILNFKKNKNQIVTKLNSRNSQDQLIILSTILTFVQIIVFLFGISLTPYLTASLRESITIAEGEELMILNNPSINNTIYYLILMPVFIAIFPISYIIWLAFYLEILKRIKEKKQERNE